MAKIRYTCACSLAGVAAIMLGATALSSPALAQTVSAPKVSLNVQPQPNNIINKQQATDPGVRGGAAGAGQPLPGLTADQLATFNAAKEVFNEVDDVAAGLGPGYNLDGCGGCHSQPATGGVSPQVNPQVAVAARDHEKLPKFLDPKVLGHNTSASEVRLKKNPDGSPDG